MPSDIESFKRDLLQSVKQMRSGQAARVTHVKLPQAAESPRGLPRCFSAWPSLILKSFSISRGDAPRSFPQPHPSLRQGVLAGHAGRPKAGAPPCQSL